MAAKQVRALVAIASVLCVGTAAAAAVIAKGIDPPRACLQYDSEATQLSGTLFARVYYGPPGYGERPAEDSREGAWLLLLDAPICVTASPHPESDNNSFERDQIVVQLAAVHVSPGAIEGLVEKRVVVSGQLYHALTGHHRTPVLLDVHGIQAQ
ncbi:DUF4431 domain-containing protein [Burkholderiaceae bacterium UC74_6]